MSVTSSKTSNSLWACSAALRRAKELAAICALNAIAAGLQATGSLSRNAERQTVSMLGQICADNQLIALRLRRQLPDTGNTSVECAQAGRLLQVEVSVRPTPNPNFRRVDARVLDQGAYVLQVSTVMGRN
mgnify:CR=1 FL=1